MQEITFKKFTDDNIFILHFQAWVMLQTNTMCNNMPLSDLLNMVNKSGNIFIYQI